jgi:hypothetical protein
MGMRASHALVVLALGCGMRGMPIRDDIRNEEWTELRTEHFVMRTNVPPAWAGEELRRLEQIYLALGDFYTLAVAGKRPPTKVVPIIHLARCQDLQYLTDRDSIGGFVGRSPDFESERTIASCHSTGLAREILFHELAHNFNYHYLGVTPDWLNEGLATFYQTVAIRDGKAILGEPSIMDRGNWASAAHHPVLKRLMTMAPPGGGREFHFASWKFVHLLMTNPAYQARFRGYLGLISHGVTPDEAWQKAFRDVSLDKLQDEYGAYHLNHEIRLFTAPYALREVPPPTARRLRAGEAHAVWLTLQLMSQNFWKGADPTPIRAQMARAEKDDPSWPGLLFWRAAVAYYSDDSEAAGKVAEDLLLEYVNSEPNDPRARLGLVISGHRQLVPKERTGLEPDTPAGLDRLEPAVRELLRVSHSSAELNRVAWHYALARKPEIGLNFVDRALANDAGCLPCLDTRALLYYQLGRFAEAIRDQERLIALFGEVGEDANIRKRLAGYRAAAEKAKRDGSPALSAPAASPPSSVGEPAAPSPASQPSQGQDGDLAPP